MHTIESPHWSFWNHSWRSLCCKAPVVYDFPKTTWRWSSYVTSSLMCWECDATIGGEEGTYAVLAEGLRDKWTDMLDAVLIMEP